jgi:hypothetical protein
MTEPPRSPPNRDDILKQAEDPANVRMSFARILLRQDLVTRHNQLESELAAAIARDATSNERDQAPDIARQLTELQAEMEAAKVEFWFRNIGKKAWADLLAKHPPTKAQREQIRGVDFNPEEFPIEAMAASCWVPEGMDTDAIRRLEAVLTDSQFTALWKACVDACMGGTDTPKSLAAGQILRANGQYATTAVPAASDAASS